MECRGVQRPGLAEKECLSLFFFSSIVWEAVSFFPLSTARRRQESSFFARGCDGEKLANGSLTSTASEDFPFVLMAPTLPD